MRGSWPAVTTVAEQDAVEELLVNQTRWRISSSPAVARGSDDVDDNERGLRMTVDDGTRPTVETQWLEEATKAAR